MAVGYVVVNAEVGLKLYIKVNREIIIFKNIIIIILFYN